MMNYPQLSKAVSTHDDALSREVFYMGSELEEMHTDAEEKQKGVHAILNALKEDLADVEAIADTFDQTGKSMFHERINNMYAMMNVAYTYNDR